VNGAFGSVRHDLAFTCRVGMEFHRLQRLAERSASPAIAHAHGQ
jgi:hypothetical protein